MWRWKYHLRRWALMVGCLIDRERTQQIGFRLGWLESADRWRMFMSLDPKDKLRV
jgi:hypothetical protein